MKAGRAGLFARPGEASPRRRRKPPQWPVASDQMESGLVRISAEAEAWQIVGLRRGHADG